VAATILPFVVVLGAESFYHSAHHPGPRETVLPILLLGKAGMVSIAHPERVIDAASPVAKPLQEALEYQLAPMRKLLAGMPNFATRCRLEDWYENFVVCGFAPDERAAVIEAAHGQRGLIPWRCAPADGHTRLSGTDRRSSVLPLDCLDDGE
jgi:hypothetical protein